MAVGSLTSFLRQGPTAKSLMKSAAQADGVTVQKSTVYPSEGVAAAPRVDEPDFVSADFYRYGRVSVNEDERVAPRTFTPFDDDQNTASIRVRANSNGTTAEKDLIPAYTKFFLDSVQESHQERSQIVETFGDFYVFLYGERPPIYSFSGVLMNSQNANWVQDFMFTYENYLRGTRCAELKARAILTYAGRQVEGFILSTGNQTSAATDGGVPFSFQMVITSRKLFGFSEDFAFARVRGSDTLVEDETLAKILETIAGAEGKGSSNSENSAAYESALEAMGAGSARSAVALA